MRALSAITLVVPLMLAAAPSRAETRVDCIAAAEQVQPLQHDGNFREARARLRVCTQPQCPAIIRSDCTKWLAELDAATPTVVVHATDRDGNDLSDVRVFLDGALVLSTLDGRDLPLDPGPHVLRLEHAGDPPVEDRVVVDVGAKHRLVSIAFAPPAAPPPSVPAPASGEHEPEVGPRRSWVIPATLGGVGLAAVAVGGVLWGRGVSACRSNLDSSAAACDSAQLSSAHGSLVAGDVLVTSGLVLGVAGLVVWLVRGGEAGHAPRTITALETSLGVFRLVP
jgi:hypothetical protein